MANASPQIDRRRVDELKLRAGQILLAVFPITGRVEMLRSALIQSLCELPALDYAAAVQAVNELIDEGKVSWYSTRNEIFESRDIFRYEMGRRLGHNVAPPDPYAGHFVCVEGDWLSALTKDSPQIEDDQPGTDNSGPAPITYLTTELCKELGVTSATLNKYAKLAKVHTPRAGQRDHRYTASERSRIYQAIASTTSDAALAARSRELLENKSKARI